ncbi:hypothetical protein GO002_30630 [Streptomyces eurocidicus]|nr:hypothetical protein [Streptomyces eurocidicus]
MGRLAELGIEHVFGVPGDFNLGFLDQITEAPGITWIGNSNELNAGYAARPPSSPRSASGSCRRSAPLPAVTPGPCRWSRSPACPPPARRPPASCSTTPSATATTGTSPACTPRSPSRTPRWAPATPRARSTVSPVSSCATSGRSTSTSPPTWSRPPARSPPDPWPPPGTPVRTRRAWTLSRALHAPARTRPYGHGAGRPPHRPPPPARHPRGPRRGGRQRDANGGLLPRQGHRRRDFPGLRQHLHRSPQRREHPPGGGERRLPDPGRCRAHRHRHRRLQPPLRPRPHHRPAPRPRTGRPYPLRRAPAGTDPRRPDTAATRTPCPRSRSVGDRGGRRRSHPGGPVGAAVRRAGARRHPDRRHRHRLLRRPGAAPARRCAVHLPVPVVLDRLRPGRPAHRPGHRNRRTSRRRTHSDRAEQRRLHRRTRHPRPRGRLQRRRRMELHRPARRLRCRGPRGHRPRHHGRGAERGAHPRHRRAP